MPSSVIKILLSVQSDENKIYNEYVCVNQFVTGGKVSEWSANKASPATRWIEQAFTKVI